MCGGHYISWNGTLNSPYYPSYYPPNIDCRWIIRVSAEKPASDDFALCDIKMGEMAFVVGEMEGKHTKSTASDFLGTHF